MKPVPVVVIPVHQPFPTAEETFSLVRCAEVLYKHDIIIVYPTNIDPSRWVSLIPAASAIGVTPDWMQSIRAYNRMMINPTFFDIFDSYTHLLIHEPDALVVSDCLVQWCKSGFDYIGAPWFEGYANAAINAPFVGVGNSGFSLFNLDSARAVLKSSFRWYPYKVAAKDVMRRVLRRPGPSGASAIKAFWVAGQVKGAHLISNYNCDIFWSIFASKALPAFSIPSPEIAASFAWEVNPSVCHRICDGKLPFGIHAWCRYDKNFIETTILKRT